MKIRASDVVKRQNALREAAVAVNQLGVKTKNAMLLKTAAKLHKQSKMLGTKAPPTLGTQVKPTLGTEAE